MQLLTLTATALAAALIVQAHPGHDIQQEVEERGKLLENSKRDISHCAAQLKERGYQKRTIERRTEILRAAREKRGLPTETKFIKARDLNLLEGRDAGTVLNTSHLSPTDYTTSTPLTTLFAGNQSCILVPEVTEGPYYVSGEYIRSDIREFSSLRTGIDLYLDIQVIDVSTCFPVPSIMIDLWHANATGVYSGVVANGNGDSSVASNINNTFNRGLQETDDDGIVNFLTYYPGHYTGRTEHVHVATHLNGTILPNNTFAGSTITHIGQIFLDQSLSTSISLYPPYINNTQPVTTNAEDQIFIQEAALGDPVAEYSLLGEDVSDGIFAWIAFGIDVSRDGTIVAAATLGEDGGVANPNSGGPGGGAFPSGAFPSGFTPGGPIPTSTATATA